MNSIDRAADARARAVASVIYGDRRPVKGEIVALMHFTSEQLGLRLIDARSRAFLKNEIHELMVTDEDKAAPGVEVKRISPFAFFEVTRGGVGIVSDEVRVSEGLVGVIAGYDLGHMPNHMNVIVKSGKLDPPAVNVGDVVIIKRPNI